VPRDARQELEAFRACHGPAIETAMAGLAGELLDGAAETVARPIRYALAGGGKRLRPLLCIAAYHAVARNAEPGGAPEPGPIHRVAAAIEIVHTYSLVHDDLPCMDDDDLRRGRASTHRAFDVPRAVVAGAAMIPLACEALVRGGRDLGLARAECAALVRELARAAGGGGMVGGQWLDLEAEGREITPADLEDVHRRKTGALLAAAVRIGALAGRAEEAELVALDRYGAAVGLAFQIADDVLDVTGTAERLGKTAGRDRELSKATFPAVLGLERARARAEAEADSAIQALAGADLPAVELVGLAKFAIARDR